MVILGLIPVSASALELALKGRTSNTWGEKLAIIPENKDENRPAEGRFNRRDCLEKDSVSFTFDISIEGARDAVALS